MRKYIKNNILEIFETLHEAHEIIAKYIDNKKFDNACNLLADCQDTATQLYSIIEESEGEEFVTLSLINEYYEELFNIANDLSEKSKGSNVKNRLNKRIDKAEASARNDIKVKLEIVFMPYKASMWDSLESVWKAADKDPDCDAYVVPIPYFDRKPDHSFGEFHYEGNEYPDYVPVVHYNSYNLRQRRPDAIYIHNPYDGNNFVTSVHPNFYSSELKKYTDELVYIPYFVLAEPNPDDPNSVEGVAHFAITPGVINADKVIVQSEAMKQTYIKALLNKFGDIAENRNILEKKILGTGSPKFDKIAATSKDNIDIPDEWLKIIKKPDGTWKKVIFYNTSVGALLEQNEKMLEKMRSVFKVFYEYREEVALLWRPHPLIKATIESMRPQLWEDYSKIVYEYISNGWGIYDDTSDLDRAIVLSDGYYGDWSSVVQLCQKRKMPIMIQNTEVLED